MKPTPVLITIILIISLLFSGCAAFKQVARTVNDVASVLCEVVAADYTSAQRDGLSPAEWCAIKKNLDPFLDYVLTAQQQMAMNPPE